MRRGEWIRGCLLVARAHQDAARRGLRPHGYTLQHRLGDQSALLNKTMRHDHDHGAEKKIVKS